MGCEVGLCVRDRGRRSVLEGGGFALLGRREPNEGCIVRAKGYGKGIFR